MVGSPKGHLTSQAKARAYDVALRDLGAEGSLDLPNLTECQKAIGGDRQV